MLIIGHRGAAGEKSENSLTAIKHAIKHGADMVEFDVRMTKDNKVILAHDFHLYRSYKKLDLVRRLTLSELRNRASGSENPIVTLEEVLKLCQGKIFMMIELKDKGSGLAALDAITKFNKDMLDSVLFTSFSVRELIRLRNINQHLKLGMMMRLNPLSFLAWERKLHLSAVGFHRLHLNKLAVEAAHQLDMFVYVYTVNRKGSLPHLEKQGVDGVITDYPAKFIA
jgi:glycerophosphoryl diester phosphodiesterase